MTIPSFKSAKFAFFFILVFMLIGCVDSANYKIFRESLDPLSEQIEVGMSKEDVLQLLEAYPEVDNHVYPYSSDHSQEFDLDEDKSVIGQIFQLTMDGDPADAGVTSICFAKVLLVDDGSGEKHVIQVADVSCPA